MITQEQLRAARVLLGWRQIDLARKAGVAIGTVNQAESGDRRSRGLTMKILAETLMEAGIIFVPGDETTGPGVLVRTELINSGPAETEG